MFNEKDFCDCETSIALKELGFREKCFCYYDILDNVGLLYNTEYTCEVLPCQYMDCTKSHNTLDDDCVDAPTLYEVQKWLRDEKNIHIGIMCGYVSFAPNGEFDIVEKQGYYAKVYVLGKTVYNVDNHLQDYDTCEEALVAGIRKAIEILKVK